MVAGYVVVVVRNVDFTEMEAATAGHRCRLCRDVSSCVGRRAPCLVLAVLFRMVNVVMNSGVLKRTNSARIRRCSRCLDDDLSNVSFLKFSDEAIAAPSSLLLRL